MGIVKGITSAAGSAAASLQKALADIKLRIGKPGAVVSGAADVVGEVKIKPGAVAGGASGAGKGVGDVKLDPNTTTGKAAEVSSTAKAADVDPVLLKQAEQGMSTKMKLLGLTAAGVVAYALISGKTVKQVLREVVKETASTVTGTACEIVPVFCMFSVTGWLIIGGVAWIVLS